jgi:hypothetical protein
MNVYDVIQAIWLCKEARDGSINVNVDSAYDVNIMQEVYNVPIQSSNPFEIIDIVLNLEPVSV